MADSITIFEIAVPLVFVGMSIMQWTSMWDVIDRGNSEISPFREVLSHILFVLTVAIVLLPMVRFENLSDVDEVRIVAMAAIFVVIEAVNILILRKKCLNKRSR